MSGVHCMDTLGNEIVFLKQEENVALIHSGPTANYVIDSVDKLTLNHLTHVLYDGVREFKIDIENPIEVYESLRDILDANTLEEYNRDLIIAETTDGEIFLIPDGGHLLGEEGQGGSSCSSSAPKEEPSFEAVASAKVKVEGCMVRSADETQALVFIAEPGNEEEVLPGQKGYSLGVLQSSETNPMVAEVLVQNTGATDWPENTCLRCIAGDNCGIPELELASIKAGEVAALAMALSLAKQTESYWAFCSGTNVIPQAPVLHMTVV